MTMTQPKIFVPYAIALLAQQKGFNQPCLIYYDEKGSLSNPCKDVEEYYTDLLLENIPDDYWVTNSEYNTKVPAAPTYQQLVDWLRVKHNTIVIVHPHFIGTTNTEWCGIVHKPGEYYTEFPVKYDYYEAFDYTLERVLKEL